jgi:hypothetical protein
MVSICFFKYYAQIGGLDYKTIIISTLGLQSQIGLLVAGGGKRLEVGG